MKYVPARYPWWRLVLIGLIVGGCGALDQPAPSTAPAQPTPSIAAVFAVATSQPPTTIPSASPPRTSPTPASAPAAPTPTRRALPTRPAVDTIEVVAIYDEQLNPNWSLEHSEAVEYDTASTAIAQRGSNALEAQPAKGLGKLFFTVRKDSRDVYDRKRVLGVRFWLSGGSRTIATSDLGIAIVGSNQQPYWVANDTSVKITGPVTPDAPLFSETRLYDLDINRSLPPQSWVEVVVWLDSLMFDPEYTYVTGIYFKNDELFFDAYYLDHMDLLLQPKP